VFSKVCSIDGAIPSPKPFKQKVFQAQQIEHRQGVYPRVRKISSSINLVAPSERSISNRISAGRGREGTHFRARQLLLYGWFSFMTLASPGKRLTYSRRRALENLHAFSDVLIAKKAFVSP
jgi:hypothetical protein